MSENEAVGNYTDKTTFVSIRSIKRPELFYTTIVMTAALEMMMMAVCAYLSNNTLKRKQMFATVFQLRKQE